jgi:hypothetical protein
MSKTLIKGLVGGAALLALAGGSTFAGWSDFAVVSGNESGADHLVLEMNGTETNHFDDVKLAPGTTREQVIFITSRDGDTVPNASLWMTLENLVGEEDGCNGNSEILVDADCGGVNEGEFPAQANMYVQSHKVPSTNPGACNDSAALYEARGFPFKPLRATSGDFWDGKKVSLLSAGETLQPNEGVCVRVSIGLPTTATNAVQGDSSTFDLRFDLEQIL